MWRDSEWPPTRGNQKHWQRPIGVILWSHRLSHACAMRMWMSKRSISSFSLHPPSCFKAHLAIPWFRSHLTACRLYFSNIAQEVIVENSNSYFGILLYTFVDFCRLFSVNSHLSSNPFLGPNKPYNKNIFLHLKLQLFLRIRQGWVLCLVDPPGPAWRRRLLDYTIAWNWFLIQNGYILGIIRSLRILGLSAYGHFHRMNMRWQKLFSHAIGRHPLAWSGWHRPAALAKALEGPFWITLEN